LKGASTKGGKRTAKAGKRKPELLQSVNFPLFDSTGGISSAAMGMAVKNALEDQRAGRPSLVGGGPPAISGSATIPHGYPVASQFSNLGGTGMRKSVAFSPEMSQSPSRARVSKTSQIKKRTQFQAGAEEEPDNTLQRDIPDRARN